MAENSKIDRPLIDGATEMTDEEIKELMQWLRHESKLLTDRARRLDDTMAIGIACRDAAKFERAADALEQLMAKIESLEYTRKQLCQSLKSISELWSGGSCRHAKDIASAALASIDERKELPDYEAVGKELIARLRNFAIWNNRHSHYDPVPVCQEAADALEQLMAERSR